jgi:hypothetical protein
MADEYRVEIDNPSEPKVSIHLFGPALQSVNESLLGECFTALLRCGDENKCFQRGLSVECLATVAAHNRRAGCCEAAFGLVAKG